MEVNTSLAEVAKRERTIVLGNFDGVHKGHQALLKLARKIAGDKQQECLALTFYPQPQALLQEDFKYLITQHHKMTLFEQFGIERVLALAFDEKIAIISPEDFVNEILVEGLNAQNIVVGFNYSFGYKGAGDVALLKELAQKNAIALHIVPPVYLGEELINSSAIRQALRKGDLQKANDFLGYIFSLSGEVIHGRKVGRTIGIPTANIYVEPDLLLPANGVYAAKVEVGGQMKMGVLNVGMRPTLANGTDTSVEVHILDFDEDIYGQTITVYFWSYLRGESKFASLEDLKAQINQDKISTREILG